MNTALIITRIALAATAIAMPNTARSFGGRIVNGTDAPPGKYPSIVSLQLFGSHNCAGTIINENWVLTAAHCVYNYKPEYYKVYSSSVLLSDGGHSHDAVELIAHEDYDASNIENDVALIRVATPFVWDEDTAPVSLPAQGQDTPGGSNATVIGWGLPGNGGGIMEHLQEVDYWTVTDEECRDAHFNSIFDTNICAYYPGGGKGQCNGDSGGPLWVGGEQVGIVSWSVKPCTVAPYPGVFTEVAPFIDWINQHIAQ